MVKTPPSNAGGASSIPGQGIKITHAEWCGGKKKKSLGIFQARALEWGAIAFSVKVK